jgi:hypothetical protein
VIISLEVVIICKGFGINKIFEKGPDFFVDRIILKSRNKGKKRNIREGNRDRRSMKNGFSQFINFFIIWVS